MKRWLTMLPLFALVLMAVLFGFYALQRGDTRIEPNYTVGKPMPEMMLPYLEGGPPVSLKAEVQGPALVNIFASWCVPCAAESPYLMELKAQGVRIIGLDQGKEGERDPPADLDRFLRRYGDPFAVILNDAPAQATIDFGATGIPETFVVDSTGMIVDKHTGPIETDAQMNRLLQAVRTAR